MELTRRDWIKGSAGILGYASLASAQSRDPLPSWNDGAAKQAILDFVHVTTNRKQSQSSCRLRTASPPLTRTAPLWVEHPIYSQVLFAYDRVVAIGAATSGMENDPAVPGGADR